MFNVQLNLNRNNTMLSSSTHRVHRVADRSGSSTPLEQETKSTLWDEN